MKKKILTVLTTSFVLFVPVLCNAASPLDGIITPVQIFVGITTTTATGGIFTNLTCVSGTASDNLTADTLTITKKGSSGDTFTFSKGLSSSSGTFTNLNTTYNLTAGSATVAEITGKVTFDDTITGSKGANLSSATITNANVTYNLNVGSVTTPEVTGKTTFDDTATFSKGVSGSTATFSAAVSAVGFTNSGTSTITGPGGIVNTYGITGSSISLTNSRYAVEIASSSTSTAKMYIGGAFASLPTTGFPANSCIVLTTDHKMYISSETVSGTWSWVSQ